MREGFRFILSGHFVAQGRMTPRRSRVLGKMVTPGHSLFKLAKKRLIQALSQQETPFRLMLLYFLELEETPEFLEGTVQSANALVRKCLVASQSSSLHVKGTQFDRDRGRLRRNSYDIATIVESTSGE